MPPRTRCRICQESTAIGDGFCEFCGNPLEAESGATALSDRAERLAAAGPPSGPGLSADDEESEGQKSARTAFLVALGGVFCFPPLAVLAIFMGRHASRQLRVEERTSWMAGGAVMVGSAWSFLFVASIAITAYVVATAPDRLAAEFRAREAAVHEIIAPPAR